MRRHKQIILECIFIRHGFSITNADPQLGREVPEWQVKLTTRGIRETGITAMQLAELYPEHEFLVIASPLPRTVETAYVFKRALPDGRVHGPVTNDKLLEIKLGTEYNPCEETAAEIYGECRKASHWARFNNKDRIHTVRLSDRSTDGESMVDTARRARAMIKNIKKFAVTRDYTLLGVSKEGAEFLKGKKIKIVFDTHSVYLSCAMKELGLVQMKKPGDRFRIKNSEAVIVGFNGNLEACLMPNQLSDVRIRHRHHIQQGRG